MYVSLSEASEDLQLDVAREVGGASSPHAPIRRRDRGSCLPRQDRFKTFIRVRGASGANIVQTPLSIRLNSEHFKHYLALLIGWLAACLPWPALLP